MIDVTRNVSARASIDRPFLVDTKEIFAAARLDFFVGNERPEVLDDSFAFGNALRSKQTETGLRPFDCVRNITSHRATVAPAFLQHDDRHFTDFTSSSHFFRSHEKVAHCARRFIGYNVSMPMATAPTYSEEHILAYPVEYLAGIDLYNAGEFHAAHDAWEELWMGPVAPDEKLFLQAMIQSAVAFHHLQIGRPGAARQMYLAAKEKFARVGCKNFMSLDL